MRKIGKKQAVVTAWMLIATLGISPMVSVAGVSTDAENGHMVYTCLLYTSLREALAAWEVERNTIAAKVNWQFRTADARVKLSSLYPKFTTASK